MTNDAGRCRDEVVALHAFFEGWFRGTLAKDDETWARCADALADDFELVPPNGVPLDREALLAALRDAHGSRPPHFTIEIRDVRVRPLAEGLSLVVYEEWQRETDGAPWAARTSTALLERSDDAPRGFGWRHVHETGREAE